MMSKFASYAVYLCLIFPALYILLIISNPAEAEVWRDVFQVYLTTILAFAAIVGIQQAYKSHILAKEMVEAQGDLRIPSFEIAISSCVGYTTYVKTKKKKRFKTTIMISNRKEVNCDLDFLGLFLPAAPDTTIDVLMRSITVTCESATLYSEEGRFVPNEEKTVARFEVDRNISIPKGKTIHVTFDLVGAEWIVELGIVVTARSIEGQLQSRLVIVLPPK